MLAKENETDISRMVVDCAYKVHTALGPGLLEHAYEECLAFEFMKRNLVFEKQKTLPVLYEDVKIEAGYRLDFLVEESLIVKLKSVKKLIPIHEAQILTYLKLSRIKTGLLINFNTRLIKDGIRRFSL